MTTVVLPNPTSAGFDTYVSAGNVTYNYGISTTMYAGKSGGSTRHTLLKIDVSSIPAGVLISSSLLQLFVQIADLPNSYNFSIHRMLREFWEGFKNGAAPDGGQDGSTWNLRNANGSVAWGAVGGQSGVDYVATATDTIAISTELNYYTFNVLADVTGFAAGTYTNYGWLIRAVDESPQNTAKRFSTCQNTTDARRPILTTEYTIPVASGKAGNKFIIFRSHKSFR